MVLFRVAAAAYFLAHLLVAAAPVVMLASGTTISEFAPHASRRVVGQWGGAGGACCEDHFALASGARRFWAQAQAQSNRVPDDYRTRVLAIYSVDTVTPYRDGRL